VTGLFEAWDRVRFVLRWGFSPRHRRFFRACPEAVLFREFRGRVASGPFRGMRYLETASGSALAPKLLGSYERELHPTLLQLLERHPRTFIDVGAAEGYYAVGVPFVAKAEGLHSYAVDINPDAIESVRRLAALNGLSEHVRCAGSLDAALGAAEAGKPSLIMCDVEGAELSVLDPAARPGLYDCDIVVEIHLDNQGTSPRRELERRFGETHQPEWIPVEPRSIRDAAMARWCRDPEFLFRAVDERRKLSVGWLVLRRLSA
jgi:hypothetical protein